MQTRIGRPLPGRRVHFVGAGGVGMAALAELLLAMGSYDVSGSDLRESGTVSRLRQLGASIAVGPHRREEVEAAHHVVTSNAIPDADPAIMRARELGIDTMSRATLLGRVLDAGRGVAVSGTHGKTSTSAMLAVALEAAGLQPSWLVGGDLVDTGSGGHLGGGDLVVAEADEAYGSFLSLRPELAVVTNVDVDHTDHYPDIPSIDAAFLRFLGRRRDGGPAVMCVDDPGVRRILPSVEPPVVTYGSAGADVTLGRDGELSDGRLRVGVLRLRMPGRHYLLDAAGAAAAAMRLGAAGREVLDGLAAFGGVDRRFSVRGQRAGVTVVDDYAHNPAKVAATLTAARETYPAARLVALFQPHLYTRTRDLGRQIGVALGSADVVVVTDVYGQREAPIDGVTGRIVADACPGAAYVPDLAAAAETVAGLAREGDVVLTLGAGDVTAVAARILELVSEA